MITTIFKQTLFISLLGHITVFSIFSVSFGNKFAKQDLASVAFRGSILRSFDFINSQTSNVNNIKEAFIRGPNIAPLNIINRGSSFISDGYLKPPLSLSFNQNKIIFVQEQALTPFIQRKKEPVIMFYPHLPYHFLLYFKDRQAVHIELMFNIISSGVTNSIAIKRKISSGNLEADLLSLRYIGHYLFIQQASFTQNNWQTVKIDLSRKE